MFELKVGLEEGIRQPCRPVSKLSIHLHVVLGTAMLRIKIGVVIATVGARSDLLSSRALPSVEKQTRVPDAIVVVRDTGVCNTKLCATQK